MYDTEQSDTLTGADTPTPSDSLLPKYLPFKSDAKVPETKVETHVRINTEGGHVGGVLAGAQQFRVLEGVAYHVDNFSPETLAAFIASGVFVYTRKTAAVSDTAKVTEPNLS